MSNENEVMGVRLPLEWYVPGDLVARYATNMVIQRSENEFIISFFEVKPPLILGTPESVAEQVEKMKSIRATCIAQIIVAADKMPSFVDVLQRNLEMPVPKVDSEE